MNKTYNLQNVKIKIEDATFGRSDNVVADVQLTEQQVEELIKQYGNVTPTHKRKYFVPKYWKHYYFINPKTLDRIDTQLNDQTGSDVHNISTGNCFATEQDAQDELNRRQALVRIWNNYDDKYSWDIDWEDDGQNKYVINYNYTNKSITRDNFYYVTHTSSNTELPYFKSAEDRNQFVEENGSDLLVVFNIKK